MGRLKIAFPYLLFVAMAMGVVWSNLRSQGAGSRSPLPEGRAEQDDPVAAARAEAPPNPNICPPCGMSVDPDSDLTADIDGRVQRFCNPGCRERYLASLVDTPTAGAATGRPDGAAPDLSGERLLDPVCKMDVNVAWGFAHEHEGTTFYFCTEQCRDAFATRPDDYLIQRCLVCQQPLDPADALPATYLGSTYLLCSPEHRTEFKADPAGFFMHRMWGIPDWMYYVSIAVVLLVSFLMFEGAAAFGRLRGAAARPALRGSTALGGGRGDAETRGRGDGSRDIPLPVSPCPPVSASAATARYDLMRVGTIRWALRSRAFRFGAQATMAVFFLLILTAGLFGNQSPALNIAPLLTWTIWWGGLVVLIMFAGKAWCYVCPWDALAGWAEKLRLWKKTDDGSSLNLRWPRIIRNIAIATILFVGLTWIELGFGVTMNPRVTAYLGLAMLVMAVVSAFLFERKGFCRYGCLVGRVSGLYAMFAGIEIRPRSRGVCQDCRTKECVKGSDSAYGCPTFEYPGKMLTNTYCIQCTECLQACPEENLAVNLRPWGSDLAVEGKPRRDEAYLALLMLALTGFHGLTMTPVWGELTQALESWLPLGRIAAFSIGMAGIMGVPVAIYAVLVGLSYLIAQRTRVGETAGTKSANYWDYFIRYAYCVLPIALFYHLAHNLEHLLMEGQKVIALFSDPFGWGWNLFGTAGWVVPPLVSLDVLWILQVVLVAVGHVYSLWAARKISRRIFADPVAASRGQWPMLFGMIAFSVFSLWLLKQPMEMRTSAM
ncbi:MAG: YHS domain-containing protein [bacterium]|nr:YHS domain-containing protein [bacterium]